MRFFVFSGYVEGKLERNLGQRKNKFIDRPHNKKDQFPSRNG